MPMEKLCVWELPFARFVILFNDSIKILSFPLLNVNPLKFILRRVVPVLLALKLGFSVVSEPVVILMWLSTMLNPGSALALKADKIAIENAKVKNRGLT